MSENYRQIMKRKVAEIEAKNTPTPTPHTPTPWKTDSTGKNIIGAGTDKRYIAETLELLNDNNVTHDDSHHLTDAAFIVRAVNAHEELLQAAKDMLNLLETDGSQHNVWRKAIAKAEGK